MVAARLSVAWEVLFNILGCSWPNSNEHRQRLEYQHGVSSSDPNSSKSHLISLVWAWKLNIEPWQTCHPIHTRIPICQAKHSALCLTDLPCLRLVRFHQLPCLLLDSSLLQFGCAAVLLTSIPTVGKRATEMPVVKEGRMSKKEHWGVPGHT